MHFTWRVDADVLITGGDPPIWAWEFLRGLQRLMFRHLHSSFIYGVETNSISIPSADKIVLQSVDDPTDVTTLTRIPE